MQHSAKGVLVSRFKRRQQTRCIQLFALHRHLQRVRLAHVKHVKADDFIHPHKVHTGRIQTHLASLGQCIQALQQLRPGHIGQCHIQGLHRVVTHVGHHAAQCRGDSRVTRHDAGGHAHLAHHGAHMQAATAAKRHVGKLAWIVATLNRHHTDRAGHAGVGHRQDRLGRGHRRQAQRLGHMQGNGLLRQTRIEFIQQAAAQRPVGRDAAQEHIGIGHRGAGVAAPVTSRSWNAAGRFGAHLQHAARINRGDRAATGTNGLDLDHGRAHHQAKFNRGLRSQCRFATGHQRHIKRGAADVAGDHVLKTRSAGDFSAGHHARRRAGQRGAYRHIASGLARHHAAIALHDQQFATKTLGAQIAIKPLQIPPHHGLQCRVEGRGRAALELTNFRQHFAGGGHITVGPDLAHSGHSSLFIARVGIGVHKEHAHRLATIGQQGAGLFAHLG